MEASRLRSKQTKKQADKEASWQRRKQDYKEIKIDARRSRQMKGVWDRCKEIENLRQMQARWKVEQGRWKMSKTDASGKRCRHNFIEDCVLNSGKIYSVFLSVTVFMLLCFKIPLEGTRSLVGCWTSSLHQIRSSHTTYKFLPGQRSPHSICLWVGFEQ